MLIAAPWRAAYIDGWARVFAGYCDLNLAFSEFRTLDHPVVQVEKLTYKFDWRCVSKSNSSNRALN